MSPYIDYCAIKLLLPAAWSVHRVLIPCGDPLLLCPSTTMLDTLAICQNACAQSPACCLALTWYSPPPQTRSMFWFESTAA